MKLVVGETVQIQPYIFGGNRMRENLGEAHLAKLSTENWAFESARAANANQIQSRRTR